MQDACYYLDKDPFAYLTREDMASIPLFGNWDLLKFPLMRQKIAKKRWIEFRNNGKLISYENPVQDALEVTYQHNLNMLETSLNHLDLLERPDLLFRPIVSLDKISRNIRDVKVLTIGPRTEYEILLLLSYGFSIENITGLDLFSYSPWIEVGDMHEMSYPDNSFDLVILGWVFAYSKNFEKLAAELTRVAKPGAVMAIGIDYYPPSYEFEPAFQDRVRFSKCQELVDYFGPNAGKILFQNEPDQSSEHMRGNLLVLFDVEKPLFVTGKAFSLLAIPDWAPGTSSLESTLAAYLASFDASDDVSLVLWLPFEAGIDPDAAHKRVADALTGLGHSPEQIPDVLINLAAQADLQKAFPLVQAFIQSGSAAETESLQAIGIASLKIFPADESSLSALKAAVMASTKL